MVCRQCPYGHGPQFGTLIHTAKDNIPFSIAEIKRTVNPIADITTGRTPLHNELPPAVILRLIPSPLLVHILLILSLPSRTRIAINASPVYQLRTPTTPAIPSARSTLQTLSVASYSGYLAYLAIMFLIPHHLLDTEPRIGLVHFWVHTMKIVVHRLAFIIF